jgi:hypothetical protein
MDPGLYLITTLWMPAMQRRQHWGKWGKYNEMIRLLSSDEVKINDVDAIPDVDVLQKLPVT